MDGQLYSLLVVVSQTLNQIVEQKFRSDWHLSRQINDEIIFEDIFRLQRFDHETNNENSIFIYEYII